MQLSMKNPGIYRLEQNNVSEIIFRYSRGKIETDRFVIHNKNLNFNSTASDPGYSVYIPIQSKQKEDEVRTWITKITGYQIFINDHYLTNDFREFLSTISNVNVFNW